MTRRDATSANGAHVTDGGVAALGPGDRRRRGGYRDTRLGDVVIERCSGQGQEPANGNGPTKVRDLTEHWFGFGPKLLGQSPELVLKAR
jgi:hypothetical protein